MKRACSMLVAAVCVLNTTACVTLFNQPRHDLSLNAQKAVADAKLEDVLADERTQNARIANHELSVVERQLTAIRDAELLEIVSAANAANAKSALANRVNDRIIALRTPQKNGSDFAQLLVDVQAAEGSLERTAAEFAMAGPTKNDPALKCTADTYNFSTAAVETLWKNYQSACNKVRQARNALQDAQTTSGALAAVERDIRTASEFGKHVTEHLDDVVKKEKDLATQIAAAQKAQDALQLARHAEELKNDLANITLPTEHELRPLGIAGLKASIAIRWIDEQRNAIGQLLTAAANSDGTVPTGVADKLQIAATLPAIAAELQRGLKYPRVTSLVHELNRLNVERLDLQRAGERAQTQIGALRTKRDLMSRELVLLVEARASINAADCKDLNKAATFLSVTEENCGDNLRRALNAYAESWTVARIGQALLDWELTHIDHERALDRSEMALREWQNLLSVQIDALTASYATGVKAQDVGRAINAVEMGAIALGVQ